MATSWRRSKRLLQLRLRRVHVESVLSETKEYGDGTERAKGRKCKDQRDAHESGYAYLSRIAAHAWDAEYGSWWWQWTYRTTRGSGRSRSSTSATAVYD